MTHRTTNTSQHDSGVIYPLVAIRVPTTVHVLPMQQQLQNGNLFALLLKCFENELLFGFIGILLRLSVLRRLAAVT